jgi:hypothetical protein
LLLFLCHLQNFVYGVCAAGAFVLFSAVPWRRRLLSLTTVLPALGALLWWQRHLRPDALHRPRGLAFAWNTVKTLRLRELPGGPHPWLADLKARTALIPVHALRGFSDGIEVKAANALLLLVVVYFLMGLAGRVMVPGVDHQRPRMRASAWVAFAGAFAAYFLLPHHLNEFDIVTFFPRFAPLVILMALPLIPRGLRRFRGSLGALLSVPALVFCAVWGVELYKHYHRYAEEISDFRAVMAAAKPGHRLLSMPYERRSRTMAVEAALIGMGSFYPLLRPAPKSMVPLQYCDMMHMPCARKPGTTLPNTSPWLPEADFDKAVSFYDYFLVRSPPRTGALVKHKDAIELVARRGTWSLYRRKGVQ